MTITVCVDRNFARRPGTHVNRWGKRLRSIRVWYGWIAVAWYRFDDYQLVTEPHEWSSK